MILQTRHQRVDFFGTVVARSFPTRRPADSAVYLSWRGGRCRAHSLVLLGVDPGLSAESGAALAEVARHHRALVAEVWRYANAGTYLRILKRAAAALAEGRLVRSSWSGAELNSVAWQEERLRALDRRINARVPGGTLPRGRKDDVDQDTRWRRDQRTVHEYRARRLVRRGSGLETDEARSRFPDVHLATRERA